MPYVNVVLTVHCACNKYQVFEVCTRFIYKRPFEWITFPSSFRNFSLAEQCNLFFSNLLLLCFSLCPEITQDKHSVLSTDFRIH